MNWPRGSGGVGGADAGGGVGGGLGAGGEEAGPCASIWPPMPKTKTKINNPPRAARLFLTFREAVAVVALSTFFRKILIMFSNEKSSPGISLSEYQAPA